MLSSKKKQELQYAKKNDKLILDYQKIIKPNKHEFLELENEGTLIRQNNCNSKYYDFRILISTTNSIKAKVIKTLIYVQLKILLKNNKIDGWQKRSMR